MKNWTEFHIAIIYFAGLLSAFFTSVLTLLYLRPIKTTINKVAEKFPVFGGRSFKTTIILSGLLGAMSVTFRDCDGKYDYLLDSREETFKRGFEQLSASYDYLLITVGLWFILFVVLWLAGKKNRMP